MNYPKHKHPHGIVGNPNKYRIWVCEECYHAFTDEKIRQDSKSGKWGHICKSNPNRYCRCESHLEPYLPELGHED